MVQDLLAAQAKYEQEIVDAVGPTDPLVPEQQIFPLMTEKEKLDALDNAVIFTLCGAMIALKRALRFNDIRTISAIRSQVDVILEGAPGFEARYELAREEMKADVEEQKKRLETEAAE